MANVDEAAIVKFIAEKRNNLQKFQLRQYDFDDFAKTAIMAFRESTDLQECLRTPEGRQSAYYALSRASRTGLSLNPQDGRAALVAYKGKINYQVMKDGYTELVTETGQVLYFESDIVFQNDSFSLDKAESGDKYTHQIAITNRGESVGYYAAVKLTNGASYVKYMSKEQVLDHAKRYCRYDWLKANKPGSAWITSFDGNGRKTVTKALCKNPALSNLSRAVAAATTDDSEPGFAEIIDVIPEPAGASPDDLQAEIEDERAAIQAEPPTPEPETTEPRDLF